MNRRQLLRIVLTAPIGAIATRLDWKPALIRHEYGEWGDAWDEEMPVCLDDGDFFSALDDGESDATKIARWRADMQEVCDAMTEWAEEAGRSAAKHHDELILSCLTEGEEDMENAIDT